jgi:putative flippase GtrA
MIAGLFKRIIHYPLLRRFVKFGIVGGIGFVVDNLLFYLQILLVEDELWLRWFAPFFSFEGAVISNYFFFHHWVWRDRRHESAGAYWLGFLRYNLTAVSGFLIRLGVMNLLIEYFPWFSADRRHYLLASLIGATVAALASFLVVERYVFRKKAIRGGSYKWKLRR